VRLQNDMATATTTALTTASGIVFALVSGVTYNFEFAVLYTCANSTSGLTLALSFPAATIIAAKGRIPLSASSELIGQLWNSGVGMTSTTNGPVNTPALAEVYGTIRPSANGNLALLYGSEISTSAGICIKEQTNGMLYAL